MIFYLMPAFSSKSLPRFESQQTTDKVFQIRIYIMTRPTSFIFYLFDFIHIFWAIF